MKIGMPVMFIHHIYQWFSYRGKRGKRQLGKGLLNVLCRGIHADIDHCLHFCSFAYDFVYRRKHVTYELTPGSSKASET